MPDFMQFLKNKKSTRQKKLHRSVKSRMLQFMRQDPRNARGRRRNAPTSFLTPAKKEQK